MVNLGFTTMATPELNVFQAIAAAEHYGYNFICLREHEISGELRIGMPKSETAAIRNALAQSGVRAGCIFGYNPTEGGKQQLYTSTLDYILRLSETASEIGAKSIRLFVPDTNEEVFAQAAAAALEKTDINILIQNHAPNGSVAYNAEVLRMIASPRAALAFSPDHCSMTEVYEECIRAKSITRELFVTNKRVRSGITQLTHVDEGDLDWKRICDIICAEDTQMPVVIKWEKVWHKELDDYSVALPRAAEVFRRWAK